MSVTSGGTARSGGRAGVDADMTPQPCLDLALRRCAHEAVQFLAVAQEHQERDTLDLVASADVGRLVNVELDDLQPAAIRVRQTLQRRRDHAARAAPG